MMWMRWEFAVVKDLCGFADVTTEAELCVAVTKEGEGELCFMNGERGEKEGGAHVCAVNVEQR